MLNTRQNFHHSKLPKLGSIVQLPRELTKYMKPGKLIVESYPLCDNVRPYSIGIHTVNVRRLDNGQRLNLSGFYLVEND
jgi:hypothetical protein